MTVALLVLGWAGLAVLVGPRARGLLWGRLRPGAQARTAFTAALGLGLVPVCALVVLFWQGLPGAGFGSAARRCVGLIVTILTDPLSKPLSSLALVLLVAWTTAVSLGAISAWRSQMRSRALAGRRRGLVVAGCDEPFAFTAGLWRPRVVVSEGLLGSVPPELAQVVLAHEEAHRRGRHPLLVLIVESLARGLRVAPVRRAADAFRLALEMVADERAARAVGSRELVAEAVATVALARIEAPVGFEGGEVQRVRRLVSPAGGTSLLAGPVLGLALVALTAFATGHAVHCAGASIEAVKAVQCRMT